MVTHRLSAPLAVIAVVLVAIPIIIGVIVVPAGSSSEGAERFTPVFQMPMTEPLTYDLPGNTLSKTPPFLGAIPTGSGVLIASLERRTTMRASPGGHPIANLGLRTQYNSPQVMWVERISGGWLGVASPLAGNGHLGWIRRSVATLYRDPWKLRVSLAPRHVSVFHRGRQVESYSIAIGRPTAPTPAGDFAVTDRLLTGDPSGPYGCCILATSALAPHAISGWDGGNRIAIHSTPETSSIGLPVSHGCMRLTLAEGQWLIDHIPLGTPVIVRE
jgi:hypothetical protein